MPAAPVTLAAAVPLPAEFDPLTAFIVAGLLAIVGILWRDHLRADAEDRSQRDIALAGWKEQTEANRIHAEAQSARVKAEAARKRRTDGA